MFCPGCGEECPASSRFCHGCGTELIVSSPGGARPAPAPPRARLRRALALAVLLAGTGLAAAGVVLLVGGGGGGTFVADLGSAARADAAEAAPGPPAVPAPAVVPAEETAGWAACRNEVYGFRLRYPRDWHTVDSPPEQACRFFDPDAFEVDADGPTIVTSVNVFVFPEQSFDAFVSEDSGDAAVQLERTDLTLGGRRAQLVEATIDSESGRTRAYEYGIEFGGGLLVLGALEGGSADFEAAKQVVDAMAASLEGP